MCASAEPLVEPRDYGSVPGELAACVIRVGLAVRAELGVLELTGTPSEIDALTQTASGLALEPGESGRSGGVLWLRPTSDSATAIGPPTVREHVRRIIATHRIQAPHVRIADRDDRVVLSVLGRRTVELVRTAEQSCPIPLAPATCRRAMIEGAEALLVIDAPTHALYVVEAGDAPMAITALLDAGRHLDVARIGRDAVARYELLQRHRAVAPVATA